MASFVGHLSASQEDTAARAFTNWNKASWSGVAAQVSQATEYKRRIPQVAGLPKYGTDLLLRLLLRV